MKSVVCGGIAGVVAKSLVAPLERVRILRQVQGGGGSSLEAAVKVFRSEGIFGFWAGNGANLARTFPARGLAFATNDVLKGCFLKGEGSRYSFLTGGVAGAVATVATYPLDLVRGRQAGGKEGRNFLAAFVYYLRQDGFLSLYAGAAPTILGSIPFEGLKFGVFDTLQRRRKGQTWHAKIVDGAAAGAAAGLLTFPNDTVRRVLQQRDSQRLYRGYFDCLRTILKTQGPRRLYFGVVPNLIKAIPSAGIQFAVFEYMKATFLESADDDKVVALSL